MSAKTAAPKLRRARRIFAWLFGVSTIAFLLTFGLGYLFRHTPLPSPTSTPTPGVGPQPTPTSEPAPPKGWASSILSVGFLAPASSFLTAVGSLVGLILTHIKSNKQMALEAQKHEREMDLERAKLELEMLKLKQQLGERQDDT